MRARPGLDFQFCFLIVTHPSFLKGIFWRGKIFPIFHPMVGWTRYILFNLAIFCSVNAKFQVCWKYGNWNLKSGKFVQSITCDVEYNIKNTAFGPRIKIYPQEWVFNWLNSTTIGKIARQSERSTDQSEQRKSFFFST